MCENLFIVAQSALSTWKCSLRFAVAFLVCNSRIVTSTDDRHRGGAALPDSGSVLVNHLEYQMFSEVEAFASPQY